MRVFPRALLGSRTNEPRNLTLVDATRCSFCHRTTEVTRGQWKAVMGNIPSSFKNCGDDCPVEQVSWDDVQEFIGKLNQREGENMMTSSLK